MKHGAGSGRYVLGLLGLLVPIAAAAQTADTTLRRYDLAEVVVEEGGRTDERVATVHRLGVASLARMAPATAADVMRLVPGAHLQVNSRGEALVYLRGAAERQMALFLDGVPLNVPWDARFDLGLVPAALLGSMEVTAGPFSVLYGPNSAGGVVDLRTKRLDTPGKLVEAEVTGGLSLRSGAEAGVHLYDGRTRVDAGLAGAARQGDALPHDARVPFSQPGNALRTNTDRAQVGALLRGERVLSERSRLSATVLFADAEKGVAPEGHLDPHQASVRYWRYPQMRLGTVSVAGEHETGGGLLLRAQAWSSFYAQHIAQYESAAYESITATQRDGDYTHGLRLAARAGTGATVVRPVLLLSTSLHRQRDGDPGDEGRLQRYRQHTGSAAVEAVHRLRTVTLRLGAGVDAQATPLTDDKPAYDPQVAWNAAAGGTWQMGDLRLRAGAARKVRFPTPRELFGTALKRFLLNPYLKPEQVWSAEAGAALERSFFRADAVAFYQRTQDAIDQRTVVVEGRSLRQRVNLGGSRIRGVEVSAAWRRWQALRVEGHLTALRADGLEEGVRVPLAEKPTFLALLLMETGGWKGWRASLDVNRIAGAYAMERNGTRSRLPGSWLVGTRLSLVLQAGRGTLTLFSRLDNAFDATLLPQEGLPAAGRALVAGIRVQR